MLCEYLFLKDLCGFSFKTVPKPGTTRYPPGAFPYMSVGHSFSAFPRPPHPFKILVVLDSLKQGRYYSFSIFLLVQDARDKRWKMPQRKKKKKTPWSLTKPASGPRPGRRSSCIPQVRSCQARRTGKVLHRRRTAGRWRVSARNGRGVPGSTALALAGDCVQCGQWGVGAPGEEMTAMLHRCPRLFF